MSKRQLGLFACMVMVVVLHARWVEATVRWADITWYLSSIYVLTCASVGLLLLRSERLYRCGILAVAIIISGPASLLFGEYGRRAAWQGVFGFVTDKPVEFATSAYLGEILSGAMLFHIVVPLLVLLFLNKKGGYDKPPST